MLCCSRQSDVNEQPKGIRAGLLQLACRNETAANAMRQVLISNPSAALALVYRPCGRLHCVRSQVATGLGDAYASERRM